MEKTYFVRDVARSVGISPSAVVRYHMALFPGARKAWEPNGPWIIPANEYKRGVRAIKRQRAKKERDQAEA